MFCTECGRKLDDRARFCTGCGTAVAPVGQPGERDPDAAPGGAAAPAAPPATSVPEPPAGTAPEVPAARRGRLVALVAALLLVAGAGTAAGLYVAGAGPFARDQAPLEAPSQAPEPEPGPEPAGEAPAPAEEVLAVPDVLGLATEDALHALQDAGLRVGGLTEAFSDDVADGAVVSQAPAAGEAVAPASEVDLVVSRGPEPAPEPATRTEHRYTLVREAMTWDEARAWCEANGGHLATVGSAEEYDQVLSLMDDVVGVCWLGGYRDGDAWRWVTGEKFSYAAWASGEPNNDGGNENCLALLKANDVAWGWYDVPNDVSSFYKARKLAFVMEQEVEVPA